MSHAPAPVTDIASLGDSLTALTQHLQSGAALQGSALYFDYVGLTMFPADDVAALKQCVQEMVAASISQASSGSGSLFLSVYAWPLSVAKARVTVQLAYTDTSGTKDLGKLSSMFESRPLRPLARMGICPASTPQVCRRCSAMAPMRPARAMNRKARVL